MVKMREEDILKAFAEHLKNLRKEYGFTQESLADKANLDLSHIAKIETCKRNPRLSTLVQISLAMNIPLSQLTDIDYQSILKSKMSK